MAPTLINEICSTCLGLITTAPISVLLLSVVVSAVGCYVLAYIILAAVSPVPRKPFAEEKTYRTITKDGSVTEPHPLPCWQDTFEEERRRLKIASPDGLKPEPAELFMSVVVPAYNEESRLAGMLEEAVTFLEHAYGNKANDKARSSHANGKPVDLQAQRKQKPRPIDPFVSKEKGWEILIVSDGSTDRTEEIAFSFAREHQLSAHPKAHAGPWSSDTTPREGVRIPPGSIRVIKLAKNRGKGGAVVHGMRHVRGKYVVFADADGASKFDDLSKLVAACQEIEDSEGRGVAVGSRAHMVGSEAVVKRSKLRNFLMHSFHFILWLLTPPKTAMIKDTQCGFKLFSRTALPYIVPYMHLEGWIFDVEMLMLAEFARIPVAEVPVGWREVSGSKLNVLWDSIGMAYGLLVLRGSWMMGVYQRK